MGDRLAVAHVSRGDAATRNGALMTVAVADKNMISSLNVECKVEIVKTMEEVGIFIYFCLFCPKARIARRESESHPHEIRPGQSQRSRSRNDVGADPERGTR